MSLYTYLIKQNVRKQAKKDKKAQGRAASVS